MSLDLRTITVFSALLGIAQLFVPLFYAHIATPYKGIRYWAASTVCSVLGFMLIAGRDMIPDVFSIVLANTLLVMNGCFTYSSCRLFAHRTSRRQWLYVFPIATAIFMALFSYGEDNPFLRALYYNVTFSVLVLLSARELFRAPDPRLRLSYWGTGFVFVLYALFVVGFRLPVLFGWIPSDTFSPIPTQIIVMLVNAMAAILWTMGFAFMVTQRLVLELRRTATHDFLTETLNRRAAQEKVNRAIQRYPQTHAPLSVLMLDIDHFKRINDQYGHEVGDQVLVQIAAILRQHVRNEDMVARWGGEEFLLLFQNMASAQALAVAQRLTRVISATPIHVGKMLLYCNVSIGVATTSDTAANLEQDSATLIRLADDALYHAKRAGRNRAIAYVPETEALPEPTVELAVQHLHS